MTGPSNEFHFDLLADGWVRVVGDSLAQPVDLKIKDSVRGVRVIGLRIDNAQEVTSAELRFRLGEISAALARHLVWLREVATDRDEADAIKALALVDPARYDALQAGAVADQPGELFSWAVIEQEAARSSLASWLQRLENAPDVPPKARGRGAKAPTDDEYRAFAKAYLIELASGTRGAKQRVASKLSMDRTTAYRWIRHCEERGYLPPTEGAE